MSEEEQINATEEVVQLNQTANVVAEPEEEFDWESTGKNNKSTTLPSSNA
ncbi:MAG: hypothetical protein IPP29_11000 [Bacteroidetes bacterium]|nr:hypothetical protein [Bacteroidota bacterium]